MGEWAKRRMGEGSQGEPGSQGLSAFGLEVSGFAMVVPAFGLTI
jgi:hypothetical protein